MNRFLPMTPIAATASLGAGAVAKLKYTPTDVTVVDVERTGRVAAGGDRVCLTYAEAEIEYTPTNPNGTPGAPVKAQF